MGAIRLRRPSLYCESGQRGSAPLETTLALTGRRKPPDHSLSLLSAQNFLELTSVSETPTLLTSSGSSQLPGNGHESATFMR
jgi:hypothetical protein